MLNAVSYEWDFWAPLRHFDWLMQGLLGTLLLAAVSLCCALPIGLVVATLRLSPIRTLSIPATLYVNLLRNSPALVLLFWTFFALPLLLGIRLAPFPAAVIAISAQFSALFAEIFRAGILSIERGQWDAARAIGMRHTAILRYAILPPAIRRMLPALFSHVVDLMKTTSLAATVSYADLMSEANRVATETYRPIETFTIAGGIYFVILFSGSRLAERLEWRLARSDRREAA